MTPSRVNMVRKSNKCVWLAIIVGAAYGLLYPFISDIVGHQDPRHLTTVLPISVVVGALCGLVVGSLWKHFANKKTTHGW